MISILVVFDFNFHIHILHWTVEPVQHWPVDHGESHIYVGGEEGKRVMISN